VVCKPHNAIKVAEHDAWFAGLSFAGLSFAGLSFAGLSFAVVGFVGVHYLAMMARELQMCGGASIRTVRRPPLRTVITS